MLDFLFKKEIDVKVADKLNQVYEKLTAFYNVAEIPNDRKEFLKNIVLKNGYLPYPYFKVLNELTPAETLFALQEKWIQNGVFKDNKFIFTENNTSVLARQGIKTSEWIKKEGHDIKLINLAGLGNHTDSAGKFIDWLKQLLILPTGNLQNNILNTTIYLIPFHPREFGCAYLPKSSEVSKNLLDKEIEDATGLNVKEQVKIFIQMAQLAGHPVIYDILPQTGRFSKVVLAKPYVARWFDIKQLQKEINEKVDEIINSMEKDFDAEDLEVIKDIYKKSNSIGDFSEYYQNIFNILDSKMDEVKKELSNKMMLKSLQIKLQKRVAETVAKIENIKPNQKLTEKDITHQIDIIKQLIAEGLWSAPGGAWCSAGVPVYDKMSECEGYPTFKHYDYKGEDVTHFANLDCQTPYYFTFLEDGTPNNHVIEFFVNYMQNLQKEYNFDGFRIDHIDHVVDNLSEQNNVPISYRTPKTVLGKLNTVIKSKIPYFATLAEYMLWDNYYKEYHQDMNFDLLWGNDIVSQFTKTPEQIIEDNQYLANYNSKFKDNYLSILKAYNNQDGEFKCIDQYPGQLGEQGALFKWFKYKFLSGGKLAQRPVLYIDGDESFTKKGIEHAIGEEISMQRECNMDFFEKFNAIDVFVKNNNIITDGEAQIITQDEDGFVAWLIRKEPLRTAFLVVANYHYPSEKVTKTDENGNSFNEWINGDTIFDKKVVLPCDYKIIAEQKLDNTSFEKIPIENCDNELNLGELQSGEYKLFELQKL